MYKKIFFGGVILLALAAGIFFLFNKYQEPDETVVQAASDNQQNIPELISKTEHTKEEQLKIDLFSVISKYPGYLLAVSINSLADKLTLDINGEQPMVAASTTKTIVAAYAYQQAESGIIKLDDPLPPTQSTPTGSAPQSFRLNIQKLIIDSDNQSWKNLLEYFGYENIDRFMFNLGYQSFTTNGNNVSSNDITGFIKELYNGKLLNTQNTAELIDYMSSSFTGPLQLKSNFQNMPNKAGWLEDRMHLVGVLPDQELSFSIFSQVTTARDYDYTEGSKLINDLLGVLSSVNQPL